MKIQSTFSHGWRLPLFLLILGGVVCAVGCGWRSRNAEVEEQLRQIVAGNRRPEFAVEVRLWKTTEAFYKLRNFATAWSQEKWWGDRRRIRLETTSFLECLRQAGQEGLDPQDYPVVKLSGQLQEAHRFGVADFARLDIQLTYTFFEYASHLSHGRVDPRELGAVLRVRPTKNLGELLEQALARGNPCAALAPLAPSLPEFAALRRLMPLYRKIAQEGDWPAVATSERLKIGDRGGTVLRLRQNLQRQGDLNPSLPKDSDLFDEHLAEAVRKFEARNGLPVDGIADVAMLTAVNEPVEALVRKIELNLERMRWLPEDLGHRHIRVNLPDYHLQVLEHGRPVLEMRAVVGKKENPTPMLSDELTYLTFNPFWYIPESIALKEILPLLLKDEHYTENHGIQIVMKGDEERVVDPSSRTLRKAAANDEAFPYLLRQLPGPENALGKVKFMFPNQLSIYLHDTPTRDLFSRSERDYSHGCVRVEQAVELAEYLLKEKPGWTSERIHKALESDETETVTLAHPVPVHLLYWSVWVDANGHLQRRPDIYGLDRSLERLLLKRKL
jgi:L,D-transpeptidase YcbB